jgi:hypothetical protein
MMRYEGKPFLHMLDCYVMRAIGELPPHHDVLLSNTENDLAKLYGVPGRWFDIVARQMNLPAEASTRIAELWQAERERARDQRVELDAWEFTRLFVDVNYAS